MYFGLSLSIGKKGISAYYLKPNAHWLEYTSIRLSSSSKHKVDTEDNAHKLS